MPKHQAYVVTVGTEIGVFTRWLDVQHRTDGISGAAQQGFRDWDEAKEYFDDALARGETRVVTRAPQPERRAREQPAAEMKAPKQRQRPAQQKQPTRSEQKPRTGGGSSVARGGSWSPASGSAKRDAEIKAAVEEVNREKQRSASARERRTEPLQRAAYGAAPSGTRAITAPPRLPTAVSPHPVSASASAAASASRQRQQVLSARASVPPAASAREAEPPKSSASFSTSSSPPTAVTQTKNIFSSDGGNQSPGPYAQSLSYASSPGNWSAGLRSPPLASSDCQSHLSEPSTLRTQYFPSDFLARQAKVRSPQRTARSPEMISSPLARSPPAVSNDRRPPSPAMSDSEYATAPNTPEVQSVDLPAEHSPGLRRRTSAEAMPPPPLPPPPRDTTRMSEGTSESTTSPSKRRKSRLVGRSMSEAQVQTEHSIHTRRRMQDHAAVQTNPPMKQYMEGQAQTSPVSSPRTSSLRATSSEGNVFGHSPASTTRPVCMCVRPRHICRFCGGEERTHSSASHSPAPSLESSVRPPPESTTPSASPVSVSSKSRASPVTPVPSTPSSPSSERQSLRSPVGGHTPILGPSETQMFMRPITNSIQATMDAMNFSEPARGAGAVVHDMRFDPRSPIQRGTTIPAGTSGSVTRPSPAMLPLNSLLFG